MFDNAAGDSGDEQKSALPAMGFLDHLEELRTRLVYSIAAVAVGFFACWWKVEVIYDVMQRPIVKALKDNGMARKARLPESYRALQPVLENCRAGRLISYLAFRSLSSSGCSSLPASIATKSAMLSLSWFRPSPLFSAGGYFGFKIVYPQALGFLIHFGRQFQPMITIGEYTSLFLSIVLGMGLIFEMPILIFFLALMGIITASFMWKNFRYAILIIFIIAGIVSPTPDMVNMFVFAAPMLGLYAISIGIAYLVHPTQRKAREARQEGKS